MATILKKYAVLLLFVSLKFVVYSQQDYQTQMDNIFDIPASKVTTGLLINRSPDVIEMQNFKLQSNANNTTVINAHNWLELFYKLYGSYLNMNSFPYDITLINKYFPGETADEQISLGLIYYHYDKIKDFAVQNGLLSVDTVNQKIIDISPRGQSPLEVDTCFAASLLADTLMNGTIELILKDSLFVSNKQSDIQEIYIDFDNGQGYIKIYPNQPIVVSYSTIGNKTVTTKIVVGSKSYYASSNLYVKQLFTQQAPAANVPTPDIGPAQYPYNGITAWYGIWYRCNHDNTIRKPLLVVSGFDPSDMIRIAGEVPETGAKEKAYLYNVANKDGFLDRLRELGYDIIIYRSANSTKSIITNAMNLVNFMQEKIINVQTYDNELIVLGASMGGLVCRYALTYMENHNIPHRTKLFISMDSPQNGANVPLGFQYMAYYLDKDLMGTIPMLGKAVEDQLGCVAAKQMLLYHYEATQGNTAKCHSDRTTFLNNLASIGNFPQKCTTMAISLGSGIGTTQGFSAGSNLIKKNSSPLVIGTYWTLDMLLLLFGIPPTIGATLSSITWEFEVNAVPNQTSKSIYKEDISLKICIPQVKIIYEWWWVFMGWPPIVVPYLECNPSIVSRNKVVNNTMPLDNAPASIRNWHNLKDFSLEGVGQVFTSLGVTNIDQNPDAFIPAYSALGLNLGSAPHTHIKNYLNSQSGVTQLTNHLYKNNNPAVSPFDYLYIENKNDDHIFNSNKEGVFSADLLATMDEMISSEYLYLKDKTINSGEKIAYEATKKIEVDGNFVVNSGGSLKMNSEEIVLKPGFHAKAGSEVHLSTTVDWVCVLGVKSGSQNTITTHNPPFHNSENDFEIIEWAGKNDEKVINYNEEVKIYPNPVNEILNIELKGVDQKTKITIFDLSGRKVFEKEYIETNININFSQYQQGTYIVKIQNDKLNSTGKIIKW